ncbi:hypothetical protein P4E94_19620 [Pontiellaceae bacterium B12219]|nr:hypothetical protein [Pontiellaceae bacterium B12219]
MKRKHLRYIGILLLAFTLPIVFSFITSVVLNQHRSLSLIITQDISVPDLDEKNCSTNNFTWSEITESPQFGKDFNRNYYVENPSVGWNASPPIFEAGNIHDGIYCARKCRGNFLSFRLFEDNHYERSPHPEMLKIQLRKFNIGMLMYINRLKRLGVTAEPIGEPEVFYRPYLFLHEENYLTWQLLFIVT